MSEQKLPAFFKDETGFCYVATPLLAKQSHLTPWDGPIDKRGFAVVAKETAAPKPAGKKKQAEEAKPVGEPVPTGEQPAAVNPQPGASE